MYRGEKNCFFCKIFSLLVGKKEGRQEGRKKEGRKEGRVEAGEEGGKTGRKEGVAGREGARKEGLLSLVFFS